MRKDFFCLIRNFFVNCLEGYDLILRCVSEFINLFLFLVLNLLCYYLIKVFYDDCRLLVWIWVNNWDFSW